MNIKWTNQDRTKPEAEKEVLLLCKVKNSNHLYKCIGFYEPHGMLSEDSDYIWEYEVLGEYDEEYDDYLVNSGWYEKIHNWDDYSAIGIMDDVIGWAELNEEVDE